MVGIDEDLDDTYLNGFPNETTIAIHRSFMTSNFSFKVIEMNLQRMRRKDSSSLFHFHHNQMSERI